MNLRFAVACAAMASLAACMTTNGSDPISVPAGEPLSAAEIPGVVAGGPYALTIYDGEYAGTTGQLTWSFSSNTVSGTFTTAEGDEGTVDLPISIEGDTLCAGEGDSKSCKFIYPYDGGFMEVTEAGVIHAVSLPM